MPPSDAPESQFCCAGCAYVFRIIHEQGFGDFYRIKDQTIAPADATVFEPRSFAWLAQAMGEAEARTGGKPASLTVDVQGVSCAACVWLIEHVFQKEPGGREVVANAQLGTIDFTWFPGEFDGEGWARKLQGFGYTLGPAGAKPEQAESSALVGRIGLCAAFALNVMLFALPAYFGMSSTFMYAGLFRLLALLMATLSVMVGGTYFLSRAVRAVLAGTVHIDLPIAIGIAGAYLGTVCGWVLGIPGLFYPDFVATFILLMLVGRWAQVSAVERNRRRLLKNADGDRSVRLADGRWVSRDGLAAGQHFIVSAGETVPVQARLESNPGEFSLASISGEERPQLIGSGHTVPSGAVSLNRGDATLCALEPWGASLLAQLLSPASRSGGRNRLLDRLIKGYVVGIIGIAVLAAAGWWIGTHDPARAGEVAIAVLVVSCPCAIGLALPLVDELAVGEARQHGVFVREGDLWGRLGRMRSILFDKTGTLTLENPVLLDPEKVRGLAPEDARALVTLARASLHPVCRSLYEAIVAVGTAPEMPGAITEEVGSGVRLGRWSLGRSGWRAGRPGQSATVLERDGLLLAEFHFADAARPGAAAQIGALRRQGYRMFILSGDEPQKVRELAGRLGIPEGSAIGGLSPSGKAEWIRRNTPSDSLMLGDGANDSLAFDAALCRGTPVIHRDILKGKADFYYLRRGIGGVTALLGISRKHRRVETAIFVFSVVYNLGAAGFAVAGLVNPLVAAVLMPASSAISLAIAGLGMRGRGDDLMIECPSSPGDTIAIPFPKTA